MSPSEATQAVCAALADASGLPVSREAGLWLAEWFTNGTNAEAELRRDVIAEDPSLVLDLVELIRGNVFVRKLLLAAAGLEGSLAAQANGITPRCVRALEMALSASGTRLCSGDEALGL